MDSSSLLFNISWNSKGVKAYKPKLHKNYILLSLNQKNLTENLRKNTNFVSIQFYNFNERKLQLIHIETMTTAYSDKFD